MKSIVLKAILPCLILASASVASAVTHHKVLCEVGPYSVRVMGEIPDGPLKYIVFNYTTEKTTIVPTGDYSADAQYHYYDFILHLPPQDTIVEVQAKKSNSNIVNLKVWESGSVIYEEPCTFGKRIVTY